MNLEQAIAAELVRINARIKSQVEAKWSGYKGLQYQGNAQIQALDPVITNNIIIDELVIWGQKALMLEYGRGSQMDTANVALAKYMANSTYWNSQRQGTAIYPRPKGEYPNLDDKTQKGSGKHPVNLENSGLEQYKAYPGLHIFREAVQKELPFILKAVASVFVAYNWTSLFPTTMKIKL